MSRNRINGFALTTGLLPSAAGGTFNEGLTDDILILPSNAAVGVHTVTLNGTQAGQVPPGDGDQIDICDPFGVLGAATTLVVTGKISALGAQIANNGAAANSITMARPGSWITFTFSILTNTWVCNPNGLASDQPVVLADAASATITAAQGRWRTLTATQANVITLDPAGATLGAQIQITRLDATAFTVTVNNGGPATGTLTVFVASKKNSGIFQFNGTDWVLREPGQT